jgi:hypothetical protein
MTRLRSPVRTLRCIGVRRHQLRHQLSGPKGSLLIGPKGAASPGPARSWHDLTSAATASWFVPYGCARRTVGGADRDTTLRRVLPVLGRWVRPASVTGDSYDMIDVAVVRYGRERTGSCVSRCRRARRSCGTPTVEGDVNLMAGTERSEPANFREGGTWLGEQAGAA